MRKSDPPPRLDDANFEKLTEHIQRLLEQVETLPLPKLQQDIFELLNCMDLLHREALTRLVELIEARAPNIKTDMADDFAIQTLMMLYDFVPDESVPVPATANPAFIPIAQVEMESAVKLPIWVPGGAVSALPPGTMRSQIFEDEHILLCRSGRADFCSTKRLPRLRFAAGPGQAERP